MSTKPTSIKSRLIQILVAPFDWVIIGLTLILFTIAWLLLQLLDKIFELCYHLENNEIDGEEDPLA